ncbi:MAG: AraC family transcriptional regulator ligand-binding domain-containing protein [Bacteroidia bacterium]|nr:AraC family transcriptional regulator ligand-binding domain-containing protein [Bacteroidia bacterium]
MAFNGRFVSNLIQFAAQQGVDTGKLFALSGFSSHELQQEGCKVPAENYNLILETAVTLSGDPYLGLHAGEYLNLAAAGLILQLMQTSSTLGEAMQAACEFNNLGCSSLPLFLENRGNQVHLVVRPDPLWQQQSLLSVQQTLDGALAFSIREYRALSLRRVSPLEVRYALPAPADRREYERVLNCPFVTGAAETAIIFDRKVMEQPVMSADYELHRMLVEHAGQKLASLEAGRGFGNVVKRAILNLAQPDFPGIEGVAANLNLSVRSLQRKLKDEGLTYRDVVDDIRQQLARTYLKKPDLSVSEIAYLLDYADPGGFVRSFKRWTGKTPQAFREMAS